MRRLCSWKLSKDQTLYTILLMPFFPVQSITMLGKYAFGWIVLYNVLAVLRCIIALITISIFVIHKRKPNILSKGIIAFETSIFVACFFNGSITFRFMITNCLSCIGFACLCQELDFKHEKIFLDTVASFFGTLAVLGAIFVVLYPNGFNHAPQKHLAIYPLGSKNSHFFYYMLFLFLKTIQLKVRKKKMPISLLWINIFFIVTTIICDSMNGFLMLLLILAFLVSCKYRMCFRKFFSPRIVLIGLCIIAAMIPLLATEKFEILFSILGRESNFSMRTYIWGSAIEMIKENPIVGNGKDGDLIYYGKQTQAHNIFLDYASKYGIISLIMFIGMLVIILKRMKKASDTDLIYICSFFMFILLFHSLFDSAPLPILIMVFAFCIKLDGQ